MMTESSARTERSLSPSETHHQHHQHHQQYKLPSEVYDLACAYLVLVFIVGFAANGSVTLIFIKRKKVEPSHAIR